MAPSRDHRASKPRFNLVTPFLHFIGMKRGRARVGFEIKLKGGKVFEAAYDLRTGVTWDESGTLGGFPTPQKWAEAAHMLHSGKNRISARSLIRVDGLSLWAHCAEKDWGSLEYEYDSFWSAPPSVKKPQKEKKRAIDPSPAPLAAPELQIMLRDEDIPLIRAAIDWIWNNDVGLDFRIIPLSFSDHAIFSQQRMGVTIAQGDMYTFSLLSEFDAGTALGRAGLSSDALALVSVHLRATAAEMSARIAGEDYSGRLSGKDKAVVERFIRGFEHLRMSSAVCDLLSAARQD